MEQVTYQLALPYPLLFGAGTCTSVYYQSETTSKKSKHGVSLGKKREEPKGFLSVDMFRPRPDGCH